jgi:hypothetical protein
VLSAPDETASLVNGCQSGTCNCYVGNAVVVAGTPFTLSTSTLYAIPFSVPQVAIAYGLQLKAGSAPTTSTTLLMGIYSDAGGVPGVLISGTATFNVGMGYANVSIPDVMIQPGSYWIVASVSASGAWEDLSSSSCVTAAYTFDDMLPAAWPGNSGTCGPIALSALVEF